MENIFEPMTLGKLELPHRLAMAPMTRSRAPRGLVTELTAEYYAQRAGAALIITEATQPSVIGQGYVDTPGLHSAEQVEAWRQVTDAVHRKGGRIYVQLLHTGRIGHPYLHGETPLAPSAVASGGALYTGDQGMLEHPVPREMTLDDIGQTIDDFVGAARNAIEAGFDGVEVHGANGYLIHQFLGDNTNQRADAYGGSVENRIRFAVELVRAVGAAIGAERTGIRLSPGNPFNGIEERDPATVYGALIEALKPYHLAYIHLVDAGDRPIIERLRGAWPGALVLNPQREAGKDAEAASAVLADGLADVIAYAKPWLANPDLTERIKAGGPYNEPDPATFYGGGARGYTDYPTASR